MAATRYAYLISRNLDPLFAISIGIGAAAIRIRKDETKKGFTSQQTIDTVKRRARLVTHFVGLGG
ncbi:hypothetical protein BT63DRAFT_452393 [Microthyrium microscopicum]|uniref:Uncharacterized protein n=1 Tax=Microthyrium microscopicum TaxID=703497 RepID=A0A6A6UHY7_9PEZI|nr:hypothetical protein BT63DRAFT_452393 [Microthyrium microscopicum]